MALEMEEQGNASYGIGSFVPGGDERGGGGGGGGDPVQDLFSDVLGIWVTGVVSLLGLAGNCLSFVVLQRAFGRSPLFFVLRTLSVSDAAFLVSVFVAQTAVNVAPSPSAAAAVARSRVQYLVWPVMMTTQMTTVWLTVLVSCERWVAICHPLREASVCTMSKVRAAVVVVAVVSVVFNVPRYFEFGMNMEKTPVGNNTVYRYLYTCALYSLLLFFLPLLLLIFLNLQLVVALRRGRRQWQQLQYRQRREQHLTIIPLTIVLLFLVGGTPSLGVNVADSINPDLFGSSENNIYVVAANFLVVVNSASNFVVYCLLGKTFRSKVSDILRCPKCCCGGGGHGGGGGGGSMGRSGSVGSQKSSEMTLRHSTAMSTTPLVIHETSA